MTNVIKAFQPQTELFKVMSHPSRLAILTILRDGEQCVCHLEVMLHLRQANISQHLMVLREAGLVADRREGWNIYYRVIQPQIFSVMDAAYQLSGTPQSIEHVHADENCPCPKCDAIDHEDENQPDACC
jgi:ArsR family transcriptional regulator